MSNDTLHHVIQWSVEIPKQSHIYVGYDAQKCLPPSRTGAMGVLCAGWVLRCACAHPSSVSVIGLPWEGPRC